MFAGIINASVIKHTCACGLAPVDVVSDQTLAGKETTVDVQT